MNITVVGGGTAGCLSALFCQRFFPDAKVTLIDSSNVGIIGVGESTTPSLIEMLNFLGISISDMVKNCGATIKNSTRFTNWNGDGKIYHHGFNTDSDLDIFYGSHKSYYSSQRLNRWPSHKPFLAIDHLANNQELDDIHFSGALSKLHKVPWIKNLDGSFTDRAEVGLHFDARKVADYFKTLCLKRGVKAIDAKIQESSLNDQGYIVNLKLDSGDILETDFIFDCTGFARLFVKETYNAKFNSFKDYLPVKKAIPFFLNREGETPTFTESIALSSGWMWKTPVEGRFGCGYVFDSDYINQDQAVDEVTKLLGFEPEINRCISFESGYFENPWNKNTLAVGLSSGFLEPLEATSIWITVISLHHLIEHIAGLTHRDEKAIDEYNKSFTKSINSMLALVQFHYFTKRDDSDFWKEFRFKNQSCEALKEILDLYSYRLPSQLEGYMYNSFPSFSWFLVGAGIEYFTEENIRKEYESYNIKNSLAPESIDTFKKTFKYAVDNCAGHNEFLEYLRKI
jgi:tryptophan halogenase